MAGVKLNRILAWAALALGVGVGLCGQSFTTASGQGVLSGRLTDMHSAPLSGVAVTIRNEATGTEVHTTTARNGSFRAEALEPGFYTVEAESDELGHGQLSGILVQAGHEARVQTAMVFAPLPPQPLLIAHPEIPATTILPGLVYSLERMQLLRPVPVPMPAFVHDPPPTETPELHAALGIPLRPLASLTALPVVEAERAATVAVAVRQPVVAGDRPPTAPAVRAPAPQAAATKQPVAAGHPAPRLPASTAELPTSATELLSTTLSGTELQQLPVSGRRWEEFSEDTPAAAPSGAGSRAPMRGAGQAEPDTAIDGMSTRLAFAAPGGQGPNAAAQPGGEPEGMGSAFAGGRGFALSEASLRSLVVAANQAEIEASRAAGGRAEVNTLRGSNGLHGQAFVFEKQKLWGAQNPFTTWSQETVKGTATTLPTFTAVPYTPPDHETVFGIGVGRQLRKDRLFWFAALDGSYRNDPGVASLKHPDLFFAQPSNDRMQLLGAQLGSGSLAFPSYSQMLETLAGLLGPAPRSAEQWVEFGRVDWDRGERERLTVEGNAALWNAPGGGLTRVSEAYGSHSFGSSQAHEQWLLGRWEAFLTPNLLAETQLSWSRTLLSAHAETPSAYEQTLDINSWGQLPQIVVDSSYGFTIGNPARFGPGSYPDEQTLHVQQSTDWAHGNLLLRAGLQFDHTRDATTLLRNQTGTYHYANVENFATDALVFDLFGIAGSLNKLDQHNCDQTGRVWRDSGGNLRGLGYLPCYSSYTQTMGPVGWYASTNNFALYASAQWQPAKFAVLAAGLRWEREQLPAAIAAVSNPALPSTEQTPALGNSWGPRVSLALGPEDKHWPVLRMGYGLYYGRLLNSTLLTVLSNTGSLKGDLSFYLRPTDNLNLGGAPPFPYVFAGEPVSVVKPGATEFAPGFRIPEVHQAVVGVDQKLPLHVEVSAAVMASLARHLPVSVDTNIDPLTPEQTLTFDVCEATPTTSCGHTGAGPIKATQITLPFYASWPSSSGTCPYYKPSSGAIAPGRLCPDYQQIVEMQSRANSTYEAATIRINRYGQRGLNLHAHYTYAHAMDWNPNESLRLTGGSMLDPEKFGMEYGTSNLDVRHTAALLAVYETPWKLQGAAGWLANGWAASGVGHYQSGLPYTIRSGGTLAREFVASTGAAIVALGEGMNGSGGDNRIYGLGNDGVNYNLGRNTYRYPATWKADLRLAKRLDFSTRRELELMVESFNLFNHQNVTELETTGYFIESGNATGGLPTLNFMTGLKTGSTAFGQPLNVNATDFYRPRQFEFGVRVRF